MKSALRIVTRPTFIFASAGLAVFVLAAGDAAAQEPAGSALLTVEQAVAQVLDRPEVVQAMAGRNAAARAEVAAESAFENPEVAYEREQLFGSGEGESEDVVGIAKTFEISGGRGLRIEAAEHRRRQVEAAAARWRVDLEQDTRLLFYRALHEQRRTEAFAGWVESLERVVSEVGRRAAAGDVSDYDLLTLTRELAFARAELAGEQARRDRDRIALAVWIGEPAEGAIGQQLGGELLPSGPPAGGERLQAVIEQSPELAALDAGVAASEKSAEAAGRAWVPDITLSAGYKTAAVDSARAHGFVVGISAPLPLLSQGRGERDAARADHRARVAERALAEARISGDLQGRAAEAGQLFDAAFVLRRDLGSSAQRLPEIAETAYRGGELGVLELVDSYRGHLESALRSLELELKAREARIELDRLTGGAGR
jgi:cobalt-zinc-cadmium efflux system outer membrane protein